MMRALIPLCSLAILACGQTGDVASLPVAEAGFDRVVPVGTEVRLDGSGSRDPDGAALTYEWRLLSQPSTSTVELVAEKSVEAQLQPDQPGNYLVSLVVNNGERTSEPDRVAVRATGVAGNVAPVAVARCLPVACTVDDCDGYECWVGHGNTGGIDGSRSTDANGDDLTYDWVQVTAANCAAECPDLAAADCADNSDAVTNLAPAGAGDPLWNYTAPVSLGKVTFKLTVSDGELTDSACVSVDSINFTPRVVVGTSPTTATSGIEFNLSGTGTDDDPPDAATLTYEWTHEPAGASVVYNPNANFASPGVTVTAATTTVVTFTLTATDTEGASSACDSTRIAGAGCNTECCGIAVTVSP